MAWGLEARVPFLDKAFLEVAMNIDPRSKMFAKGKDQQVDKDGRPYMEKVASWSFNGDKWHSDMESSDSIFSGKLSISLLLAGCGNLVHHPSTLTDDIVSPTSHLLFFGARRSNSLTASAIPGSTGKCPRFRQGIDPSEPRIVQHKGPRSSSGLRRGICPARRKVATGYPRYQRRVFLP